MSNIEMIYIASISLNIILLSVIGSELWTRALTVRERKRKQRRARQAHRAELVRECKEFKSIYFDIVGG